jgi:glycosyltransferase involved in cell wall biosynthesis
MSDRRAAAAIHRVLADPALAARLGRAAKARQHDLTWQAGARQIRAFIAAHRAAVATGAARS